MERREVRRVGMAAGGRGRSKAAKIVGIGQPTVTTHVQKLEAELGTVLFDRVKRPIQLTTAGETLAKLASPLVDGIDALAERTADADRHAPVAIASTPDIIPHILLRVVRVFLARHPHIPLRVTSRTRLEALEMVVDGDVDVGIVQTFEPDERLSLVEDPPQPTHLSGSLQPFQAGELPPPSGQGLCPLEQADPVGT